MRTESEVQIKAEIASQAAKKLGAIPTNVKNQALEAMGKALKASEPLIISENAKDLEAGKKKGLSTSLLDRLKLDPKRIDGMIEGLRIVRELKDPVGEVLQEWDRPNGLHIQKVRVPLGTIAIIYEARPNVTVDAAALCLKTGNAVILRGGSDAIHSNIAITRVISEAAEKAGIPSGAIQLIEDTNRKVVKEILTAKGLIDAAIPRGSAGLIKMVVETATIPTIETGEGNCHVYVEKTADLKMAEDIAFNAKVQRPSVCNAAEKLLVDRAIAPAFLPKILKRLKDAGVEIRGDAEVKKIDASVKAATDDDWRKEFLDLIIGVKVVDGVQEAIDHVNRYGTKHTEAIITKDEKAAAAFQSQVDASAVFVNASTRFTDGFEFGFGAEIGISTQKLHARGPMGLPELTTYKYLITGAGQVRQ